MSSTPVSPGPALPTEINSTSFEPLAKRARALHKNWRGAAAQLRKDVMVETMLTAHQRDWLLALMVARVFGLNNTTNDYVGPSRPLAIIIGDEPGTKLPSYGAFTPWLGGCGLHLLTAIEIAGLRLLNENSSRRGGIGIVNSRAADLGNLWINLEWPRIITAGKQAYHRVDNMGLPVNGHVNHPQYEKRFNFSNVQAYGEQIREYTTSFKLSVTV
jgi:hypothetical protein